MDEHDFHSGFVEVAGLAATAAVMEHMGQGVPMHHLESWGAEAAQWGMGDLEALHVHLHCSASTSRDDIRHPESTCKSNVNVAGVFAQFNKNIWKD